jgi:hypothetical protein
MNEKLIEKKLRLEVKKLGGKALKFVSPGYDGVTDRIVLMPGGRIWFREIKTTGKKLTPLQQVFIADVTALGFDADVIDDEVTLSEFLKSIR